MKISFDFDDTLTQVRFQKVCAKFIESGNEVYITTARTKDPYQNIRDGWNKDVYEIAEKLGIPHDNVRFTNGAWKFHLLKGFDLHFDNDFEEIKKMEENNSKCVGILILDWDY